MTDITATEQDRTLDKDKENNETLAMVISRRKKNGMDLRSEGNGEKKSQGKQARNYTDGRREVGQRNENEKDKTSIEISERLQKRSNVNDDC